MGDNSAINNLTATYNGTYWKSADISSKDFASNLIYTGDLDCSLKSNWDYGVTLNEDYIKEIAEKLTKERELAKITPNAGPEIPKWTGFLPI